MQGLEQRKKVVMAVDDTPDVLIIIRAALARQGFEVVTTSSGQEALDKVGKVLPDLILLDIMMPMMDGSAVLTELRARPDTNYIPVIMLSAFSDEKYVTRNLGLGADDYITKPFGIAELVARVKAKIDRPPVPAGHIMGNLQAELVNETIFNEEVSRELERARRGNSNGCIAYLELVELPQATQQFGTTAIVRVERQVAGILKRDAQTLDLFGWNGKGRYLVLLPDLSAKAARQRLEILIRQISTASFEVETQTGITTLHFTPIVGYCMFEDGDDTQQLIHQTQQALRNASMLLDMQPYHYQPGEVSNGKARKVQDYVGNIFQQLQFSIQAFLVVLLGGVIPYFLYLGLDAAQIHIDALIYTLIVVNYLFLGLVIWAEGLLAGKTDYPPAITADKNYPSASAIITAYLPECAPTIIETVEKYLAIDYPGELKIILAYNTPQKLPIEERLAKLARLDSRLILHKVENSATKSQNINSALANCVNSEFTGIFETGDQPDPDIFRKAARWIVAGYDVIQGHNLIRNGETSYISRLSAIEGESYYAASLPGKIRLGKGLVFGGTNNFWRTSVLRQTRLRIAEESSVTELVMRVALEGYKIAYDPQLISRRLAPVSWKNWANGLIKRAQGWYQVMLRHTWLVMWDNKLTLQQKLGYNYSLVWREISRWLYLQVYPLALFYITLQDYQSALILFLVVFLFIGPSQTLLTYLNAHPDIRKNKSWFIEYFFATTFYFVELKRFLACIGQIRELLKEPFTHPAISYQILEDGIEDDVTPVPLPPARSILVVGNEPEVMVAIEETLTKLGYRVLKAANGAKALATMQNQPPDLVVIDFRLPGVDGLNLLKQIRYQPSIAHIPVILLGESNKREDIVLAFSSGADDYIAKPIRYPELVARIKAKLERPTIPGEIVDQDLTTGLPSPQFFRKIIEHEVKRAERLHTTGCLACLNFEETDSLIAKYGNRVKKLLARQVQTVFMVGAQPLDRFGMDEKGNFLLLMPDSDTLLASESLRNLATRIVNHTFKLVDDQIRLTPITGFSIFGEAKKSVADLVRQAETALNTAEVSHDLHPQLYKQVAQPLHQPANPLENEQPSKAFLGEFWQKTKTKLVLPGQIALTYIISFVIPLLVYFGLDGIGVNITSTVYLIVVISLLITATLIWVEGFSALRVKNNPPPDDIEYPPTVAIIAAYLPNEAATIIETIQAFLRLQYPGDLKIILAYNTPRPLPVEKALAALAKEYPRFQAVKVENSTSKAQNVNAVLGMVNSEFVGVFDADHHPDPDSFKRAWVWMTKGYDVVQGHCLVRNGDASWVAKTVAVEFEAIYAVSHPGRAKLHSFGIFGGSNGYWRTSLLRQTRMHGFMLTEDIDSSMRVVLEGYKIASDPFLVSRELATVTLKTLWNQRMRWAQGWFQVSLKHTWTSLTTPKLNFRQKLGMLHLLAWRELYPWIAGQVIPIMIFWIWKYGGVDRIDWLVPVLLMTTLFTMSVAPGQTILAYLRADPEIKQRKKWFFFYLFISMVFYTEYKNLIARVAQVKEALLERQWKVTPRPTAKDATPPTS